MEFQVTDAAAARIAELIKTHDGCKYLRVSVDGGGCSGFMYKYEFVSHANPDDFMVTKNSIHVIIDQMSQGFVSGCTLNFVESLGSAYFEVKNPNAKAKCGCGNSFAI